ncbi:hypothetical protein AAVH_18286 [Aphelenchoides avenae]|nr:hypothetical protein AAVH_18286 [Aphelenchus avenae]
MEPSERQSGQTEPITAEGGVHRQQRRSVAKELTISAEQCELDKDPMFKIKLAAESHDLVNGRFEESFEAVFKKSTGRWKKVNVWTTEVEGLRKAGEPTKVYGTSRWCDQLREDDIVYTADDDDDLGETPLDVFISSTTPGRPSDHTVAVAGQLLGTRESMDALLSSAAEHGTLLSEIAVMRHRFKVQYANDTPIAESICTSASEGILPKFSSGLNGILGNKTIVAVNSWYFYVTDDKTPSIKWIGAHREHLQRINDILTDLGIETEDGGERGARWTCANHVNHRRWVLGEGFFEEHGIDYVVLVQGCLEAVVTFSGCLHETVSSRLSYSEAINFCIRQYFVIHARMTVRCRPWCFWEESVYGGKNVAKCWKNLNTILYDAEKNL